MSEYDIVLGNGDYVSSLENALHLTMNKAGRGGMGDVQIKYNPYTALWTCTFNWSENKPVSGKGNSIIDAINQAIQQSDSKAKRQMPFGTVQEACS